MSEIKFHCIKKKTKESALKTICSSVRDLYKLFLNLIEDRFFLILYVFIDFGGDLDKNSRPLSGTQKSSKGKQSQSALVF